MVLVGFLIVVALFSALIGPYFINWTDYRADFEREASRLLGQPVKVNGTAEARLLPVPSITFSDIQLGDIATDGPQIDVREFSMDIELAPLLSGDVKIIDMRIDGADARLTLSEDSTLNWDWALDDRVARADIELENVAITNSRIIVAQMAQNRNLELLGINGTLSANSVMGPWQGEGTAIFAGQDYKGSFSTGIFDTNQPGRIRFDVKPEDESYRLKVQGQLEREDGALRYVGDFALDTEIALDDGEHALPIRARGPLRMDQEAAIVLPLRIEAGGTDDPYVAEGNGTLSLDGAPRLALSLDGQQINIDRMLEGDTERQLSEADDKPLLALYREFSDAILALPKPRLAGSMVLNIPAIIQGEQAYRNITLNVTPSSGGWTLNKLAGDLPGRTRIEASGLLSTEEQIAFDGDLVFASRQPSGLAQWLTGKVDDEIRKIPVLGFSSRVNLSENRQNFRGLELQLGPDTVNGLIDRVVPQDPQSQERPRIVFRLAGETLNLDALSAFSGLVRDVAGADQSTHDLDVAIEANTLKGFGTTAEGVAAEFFVSDRALAVRTLTIRDLEGAEFSGLADIRDLYKTPNGAFNFTVQGDDLAPTIALMARLTGNHPFFLAIEKRVAIDDDFLTDASLSINGESTLVGEQFNLNAQMDAFIGGTDMSLEIVANGKDIGTAQGRIAFKAGNDLGERILSLLGVPSLPLDTISRLDLALVAEGAIQTGMRVNADIQGIESDEYVRFEGLARVKDSQLTGDGILNAKIIDADPYIVALGVELPGMGLQKGGALNGRLGFEKGTLNLEALNGTLGSAEITGDLTVDVSRERPVVKGKLFASEFDAALFMDALWGQGYRFASTLDGGSLLRSKLDFAAGVSSNIDFDLTLRAREIMFDDLMRGRDAKLVLNLDANGGSIEDFEAKIKNGNEDGRIAGALFAQNDNGQLILNGRFDAEKVPARSVLAETFGIDIIDGALDASGSIAGRGTSFETLMGGLAGSGTLSLSNGLVKGVREGDISEYLRPSDAKREGLSAEEIDALAQQNSLNGEMALPTLDATFSMANGRFRLPPLSVALDTAEINTDFSASLAQSEVDATVSLQLDAGKDAQSGLVPAIEFIYTADAQDAVLNVSTQPLTQFLQQRALEREQIRVAKQQVALLEKQRLRREIRYFRFLKKENERKAEEARLLQEQIEQERLAEEARVMEEARAKAGAERAATERQDTDTLNAEELDAVLKELDRLENKKTDPVQQIINQARQVAKPKAPQITQFPETQF